MGGEKLWQNGAAGYRVAFGEIFPYPLGETQ